MRLPKPIRDLLTGPDGTTYDAIRVAFIPAVVSYLTYAGVDVCRNHVAFSYVAFGTGFAALVSGFGAAIGMKQMAKAEPPAPPQ